MASMIVCLRPNHNVKTYIDWISIYIVRKTEFVNTQILSRKLLLGTHLLLLKNNVSSVKYFTQEGHKR